MSSSLVVDLCEIAEVNCHENSDNLELIVVKGWQCISKKGQYKVGDKVVFIPPDAILPISLAEELGVRNYLVGSNKDRVKCVRLRGEMSFGLLIDPPANENFEVGDDLSKHFGIVKFEPPVRATDGNAAPDDPYFPNYTNIENMRNFVGVFEEGEMVVVSEKLDGGNDRIARTSTITEDGENVFVSLSRGFKTPEGEKRYKKSFTIPDEDEVKNFVADKIKEV